MRIAAVVVLSMLAASCGPGPCTLIGCQSSVTFVLTPAMNQAFANNEAVTVKACVGTDCQTGVLTGMPGTSTSSNPALTLNPGTGEIIHTFNARVTGAQQVTLELTKNGADAGRAAVSGVVFTDFSPNGPACGPACQSAKLTL